MAAPDTPQMEFERKVLLYIAMSLDGFIAKPDNDISFLSAVEKEGEDYGYAVFSALTDTVIWGRKTYDKVLSFGIALPHADKKIFVVTRTPRPSIENITFYNGTLSNLIRNLKAQPGRHIYVDGGAQLVNAFLREQLIDEMYISVIPVLLGEGISLFDTLPETKQLQLLDSKSFEKGLVQLHYRIVR